MQYQKLIEQIGGSPKIPQTDVDIIMNNGDDKPLINYYELDGKPSKYFNGRRQADYFVIFTETGQILPRKSEPRIFYSLPLIDADDVTTLHIYQDAAQVLANQKKTPHSIALPDNPKDKKTPIYNAQLIELLMQFKPETIILHYPENYLNVVYDEIQDLGKNHNAIFTMCSAWQKLIWRNDPSDKSQKIGRIGKKYLPKLLYRIGEIETEFTYLYEGKLKNELSLDKDTFYQTYQNEINGRDFWLLDTQYEIDEQYNGEVEVKEKPLSDFFKLAKILIEDYELSINEVTTEREIIWNGEEKTIDDEILNTLTTVLSDKGFKYKLKTTRDKLRTIIKSNWRMLLENTRYKIPVLNPFKDYFNSLPPYDGKDYIGAHFKALKVEDFDLCASDFLTNEEINTLTDSIANSITLSNGAVNGNFYEGIDGKYYFSWQLLSIHFWRKWIVGCVRQLLFKEYVNEFMPILVGAANKGKTTFIQKLVPDELSKYFLQKDIFAPETDRLERLRSLAERFIILFDDNPDKWNIQTWKTIKEWITTRKVTYRKLFESETRDYPKTGSFIGTSNFRDLLADTGGDRRFLIFIINDIERLWWEMPDIDIDGVWTQAFDLAKNKEFSSNLNNVEFKVVNAINKNFRSISTEEQLLQETFRPCTLDESIAWEKDKENSDMLLWQETKIMLHLQEAYKCKINLKSLRDALVRLDFKAPHCFKSRRFDNSTRYCYGVFYI